MTPQIVVTPWWARWLIRLAEWLIAIAERGRWFKDTAEERQP